MMRCDAWIQEQAALFGDEGELSEVFLCMQWDRPVIPFHIRELVGIFVDGVKREQGNGMVENFIRLVIRASKVK